MASHETTAGAVTGPGGAPPGPSPVHPDPAVDPVFSAGDVPADPAVPAGPAIPADPTFSGESAQEPVVAVDPGAEVTPALFSEPLPPGGSPMPAAPGGPVGPVFAEPAAAAAPPPGDRDAAAPGDDEARRSFVDSADRSVGEQPSPAEATLPPELAGAARTLFGDRLDLAAAYAELLATDGVVRGLIGPRETPRLWDRHLLNCAAVAERIPEGASVIDVGSGAGLPGLVLAIARPDLTVTLVEPLARRTSFLIEAVQHLGLTRSVRVFRGRAEEAATGSRDRDPLTADIVTARAVAALDRLAAWCLPLAVPGGRLMALKGASAAEEIAEHAAAVARLGGGEPELHRCGDGVIDPPATVIEVVRERMVGPAKKKGPKRSRGGRRRGSQGRDR